MGSRLVKDINPAGSSSPNELISINGLLFFSAEVEQDSTSNNGATEEETPSNEDINSDAETSDEEASESEINSTGADTDTTQTDLTSISTVALMRSDGTSDGTTILKKFDSVTNLVEAGGQLYFIAKKNDEYQLWTSDGTTRGTKRVKNLYPNADPRYPQDLFEIDGVLFYSAIDGTGDDGKYPYVNGYEIWRQEGNGVGSRFFRNLIPDKLITEIDITDEEVPVLDENGQPVMAPTGEFTEVPVLDANGQQVMEEIVTVTTEGGVETRVTEMVGKTEFIPVMEEVTRIVFTADVTTDIFENDSFPQSFVGLNGNYFFTAQSSAFYSLDARTNPTLIGGLELWFSDGTEAGTRPININQNAYTFYEPEDGEYTPADIVDQPDFGFFSDSSSSFPRELTPARNELYFVANDGITGFELWSITDQGTNLQLISDLRPGNTSSSPEELTVIGDDLYFSADIGEGRQLFHFNPAQGAPRVIQGAGEDPKELTAIDNKIYYSAESELGRELWVLQDGQAQLAKDINPGSESSSPENLTVATRIKRKNSKNKTKKFLYFSANDGSHGVELMSLEVKGKNNNITLEADVTNSPQSSFPKEITNHDQQIFFTANSRTTGRELWTVGPAIQGPSGKAGDSSSTIKVIENEQFIYKFDSDSDEKLKWEINGGADASLFKIGKNNGKLEFKSSPDFEKPQDKDQDNTFEVYVRATERKSGFDADQKVTVKLTDVNEYLPDQGLINNNGSIGSDNNQSPAADTSEEILYYTAECGPITASGPLYPCEAGNSSSSDSNSSSSSSGSGTSSGSSIPTVSGNSNLSDEGKTNYNNYNDTIEAYEQWDNDCDFASSARFWADQQLGENDPTLAEHYNRYFSTACDLSELII